MVSKSVGGAWPFFGRPRLSLTPASSACLFRSRDSTLRCACLTLSAICSGVPGFVGRVPGAKPRLPMERKMKNTQHYVLCSRFMSTFTGEVLQKGQLFHNGRNGRETKATTAPRTARSRRRRLEARSVRRYPKPSLPTFSQREVFAALFTPILITAGEGRGSGS